VEKVPPRDSFASKGQEIELMDSARFENANKLHAAGRIEDAAHEFHALADETDDPDERVAIFANAHKCYCQLGWLDKADALMHQIRSLPHQDKFVRMIVDFADACMMAQMGKLDEGELKFERVLDSNRELLASSDNRYLYEDIQERRAFLLAGLGRYTEALPLLKEAASFTSGESDPKLVHFYLGVCYDAASESSLAKEEFLLAIELGLDAHFEASARYRVAMVYFTNGALGQAKLHLECALAVPGGVADLELRTYIYQGLSRTCHYLGEFEEEQRYLKLAQSL
jgi:tetratricopeptide (TPR) repeat protein